MTSIDNDPVLAEAARRLSQRTTGRHPAPRPEPVERVTGAAGASEPTAPVIASVGLPRHRPVADITARLKETHTLLDTKGPKALDLAHQLAANGYPSATLGDGGSRGTDGTSSTERASGAASDRPRFDQWAGVDRALAAALAEADRANTRLLSLVGNIIHHADDKDPVPVGTGECDACGRFCRPTKQRPGFRLRSGLCPSCYGAWRDAAKPDRSDWVRARRNRLTDPGGKLRPEDDSHIDMSRETD